MEISIQPGEDLNNLFDLKSKESQNPFPVWVFPPIFSNLINECKESLNFPTDYTGISILTAVSTAIGTSAELKVKSGWFEFPAIYAMVIGPAGANKSHPMSKVFNVFTEIDKIESVRYESLYNEYEEYKTLSKKEKKDILKVERPILLKSILNNFTPEILHQRLADNPKGCAVFSDELATFFEGMNNYSKGDQASTYLSFWNNKGTSIDRVSKPIPLFICQPFLNIIGGLQPRVLNKLFPANRIDNGLLQRFLAAFPDNVEKYPINDIEMSTDTIQSYNDFIIDYVTKNPVQLDEKGKVCSKIFGWSTEAKSYFYEWQRMNTIDVNKNSDSILGEVLTKYDNHFARLALILQIMEDNSTDRIGLKAVQGAHALCNYFIHNSIKILDILNEPAIPKENLPRNKSNFHEALPVEFTTAEANEIGLTLGLNPKLIQRFISDPSYFNRLAQGRYSKIITD